jgi:hypothetical protein
MDTVTLVGNQVDDGWRLLQRLQQEQIPILAASWVKPGDEDRWSLYLATPLVDRVGSLNAYREVYGIIRSLEDRWIDTSEIKLVGENHPVTRDLLDLLGQFPGRVPTRPRRSLLGGVAIDDAYLYPWKNGPTPTRANLQKIMEMIARPGPVEPSAVTLRDGTMRRVRPVGVRRLPSGEVQITLRDAETETEQVVSMADIVSLQEV